MNRPSAEEYLRPYRDAIKRHGPGFSAMLWGSREAQWRRFDVLVDLAGLQNCTIIDAGCGQGDFAEYLLMHEIEFRRYIGLDAIEQMIEAARQRQLPRCTFEVVDLVANTARLADFQADFVCISGTLNTMDEPAARRLVQASFDAAAQGVVFNFLSDRPHARWREEDLSPARRFSTVAWLDWSLSITSRVTFTQDYLDGHDATIMLRHDT
jgi:SAM-dependent methyltransferase